MVTMTIDDEIAAARGQADALEADLVSRRDVVTSAEAELTRLEADNPHGAVPPWSSRATSGWYRAKSSAEARRAAALRGIENVQRLELESTRWATQLEGRRLPKFDDAIAEARGRLAEIPAAIEARAAEARTIEARLRGFDVAEAVGDPITAGEPAASAGLLGTVQAAIIGLEAERSRLDLRVATLLERRQSAVVEIVDVERQQLAARWDVLAGQALEAATLLHAVALELERLEEAHRAAGARHGLPSGRFDTLDDQRFAPEQLERMVVNVARGLALRNRAG